MRADRARSDVGIVTVAHERRNHLSRQTAALRHWCRDVAALVVDLGGPAIDAGRTTLSFPAGPGGLPIAAARNAGAGALDCDILVFLDVDCIPGAHLVDRYVEALAGRERAVAIGPVGYLPSDARAHRPVEDFDRLVASARFHRGRPVPCDRPPQAGTIAWEMFWSLSFAVHRKTFDAIGGFDERFVGYGAEDTDFAYTARDLGVDLVSVPAAVAVHQYHPVSSPPVEHLDAIVRNACVFFDKWGTWPMSGWLRQFRDLGLVEWDENSGRLVRTGVEVSSIEPAING